MRVLLTGAAGFIGYHAAKRLLRDGHHVHGVDSFTPYYDRRLKDDRIADLSAETNFTFEAGDIADADVAGRLLAQARPDRVLHLAAQAGVRYSLEQPFTYLHANVQGQLSLLEAVRHAGGVEHLVYASSSSVYGANTKVPFAEDDRVDHPISVYAATKRAAELLSEAYAHLHRIPLTGLRFFTVYGPWGRPDMAMWLFTEAVLKGEPLRLFNAGEMKRDYTYIDDIVAGVVSALYDKSAAGHRIFNLGNRRPESTLRLLRIIEATTGRQALVQNEPMQPGDVKETYADISRAADGLGFQPRTTLEEGVPRFIAWYRARYGI